MKTLDEVIKALEICSNNQRCIDGCPYYKNDCPQYEMEKDALHYLKEYQDRKEALRNWTEKAISEQQNLSDAITFMRAYRDDKDDLTALRAYWKEQHENNALTWDELKQMEGKPVWVEGEHGYIWNQKAWSLIQLDVENDDIVICVSTDNDVHYEFLIAKEDYGTDWQAYRKERNENAGESD